MKPCSFGYAAAENREHAVEILYREGADARPLAGGQSLVPMMNIRIARPSFLVDLNFCADLDYVTVEPTELRIGCMTRQRTAETHPMVRERCPLIADALSGAGSVTIRNRGTVGGSIANGYPLAELVTVALSTNAVLEIQNKEGGRQVAAEDFVIDGMVTALEPGDLLSEIRIPALDGARYGFRRSGNHASGSAIAIVSASAVFDQDGRCEQFTIAAAGIASKPIRLRNVEKAVCGYPAMVGDAYREDLAGREYLMPGKDFRVC